jgi:hypothetical protein
MRKENENDWEIFYAEGLRYREIAEKTAGNSVKFTPEILYNLSCIAIEKLFMGYFLKVKFMPYNHTLQDLVESMKELRPVPPELEECLMRMNSFQEICSIERYSRRIPSAGDVAEFIRTLNMTAEYIRGIIDRPTAP